MLRWHKTNNGIKKIIDLLVLLCIIIFTVLFQGCKQNKDTMETPVKYLIGMSQANLVEPWRIAMNNEIKNEAAKNKDLKVIFTDAAQNTKKQINDVKELMKYGIDLLIISPNDSIALTPIISEVYNKIPVIILDRAVEGYNYTLYIGPDNKLIGKKAGEFIADFLGEKGGNIIELQGLSGSPSVKDRSDGLKEVLNQYNNIKIVNTVSADWFRDKAEDTIKYILKTDGNIDAIVAQNDAMALGAYKATNDLGIKNIKIVGVDGLSGYDGGLELVKEGKLQATFTCTTGGKEAIQYAIDILNHKSGLPKKIILKSDQVTKKNVSQFLNGDNNLTNNKKLTSNHRIKLGFVQVGSESLWRLANTESIKKAAKDENINLRYINAEYNQSKEINAIKELIKQKVDVIDFSPIVETGWDDVLKEAKDAGIPVICSDRQVRVLDDSLYPTFIGSDFYEEGKRAAKWLVSKLGVKKHLNIVEIEGTKGSTPATDRKKGFDDFIEGYKNYKILKSKAGDFDYKSGQKTMKELLKSYGRSINVVYAHNDDMALGAIKAIEEYGLKPGKDIKIVSIDGVKDAFNAMIAGKLNCTVECNPLLGPQLMKTVKDYMSGKELPLRIITSEGVFPQEVAKKELLMRKY